MTNILLTSDIEGHVYDIDRARYFPQNFSDVLHMVGTYELRPLQLTVVPKLAHATEAIPKAQYDICLPNLLPNVHVGGSSAYSKPGWLCSFVSDGTKPIHQESFDTLSFVVPVLPNASGSLFTTVVNQRSFGVKEAVTLTDKHDFGVLCSLTPLGENDIHPDSQTTGISSWILYRRT